MKRAHAAMFDHTDIAIAPSGAMSPVEMSSRDDDEHAAVQLVGQRPGHRRWHEVLAPLDDDRAARLRCWRRDQVVIVNRRVGRRGRGATRAGRPVRGSVITPVSALAAAVDGEQRYTASSTVPLRPGKLRLNVRSDGLRLDRRLADAHARPAHRLQHAGARGEQVPVDARTA